MKILLVHNAYQQRGGEDSVVDSEAAMLTQGGHQVTAYRRHNDDISGASRLAVAVDSVWSRQSSAEVGALIDTHRPDVMHLHNAWPLVSPSVIWAASKRRVPVVMTLHNFRLMCPQAMFLREEKICEDCQGHVPWRGIVRRCYRESAGQTGVLVAGLMAHRWMGTYQRHVDRFIALSQFARGKFVEAGIPSELISVKPNFVEEGVVSGAVSGAVTSHAEPVRAGGLFVGRLSSEKGIQVMAQAAAALPPGCIDVVGDGPLRASLADASAFHMLGFQPLAQVLGHMANKSFLVLPSICYENFPRTIAEAFSKGLPVIASRLGGMAEIIEDGRTGLHFEPGNAQDFAAKVQWALAHPEEMQKMGDAARQAYEKRFTEKVNLQALLGIYESAIRHRAAR